MKPTHPRSESRGSRTSAAVLLALFTLVSPLSPLFAAAARAQSAGARRPAADDGGGAPAPDKGEKQGGGGELKSPPLVAPAVVTAAQLKVTLDDGVAAGQFKRPGETITYTATIQNTNPTDAATGVKFLNDLTANPNLTFVNGSVQTQPVARADSFDVLGNVRLNVPAASGLLANDFDADTGGSTGLTITTAPTTSARGGEVSIDTATGAFTYNPPAGYDGADSFSYTVTDATGKTDSATATFNIAGMIWFVNNAAAACTSRAAGCGRLTNPFSDLQSFEAANGGTGTNNGDTVDPEAGDNIFLYTGSSPGTPYSGPLTLENTQKLIGQGASDTLQTISGVTVPPHSDALPQTNEPAGTNPTPPTITSAANGVNLAQNNTLRGFNVGSVGNANRKINGAGFGQLTVGKTGAGEADVSLSGSGMALFLQNGTIGANSAFNSVASTGSTAQGLLLTQITAGTLLFAGTTVAGAAGVGIEVNGSSADINFGSTDVSAGTNGVVLANNPAGTRSFGPLTITGGSGIGFLHQDPDGAGAGVGGGAVTVSGALSVTNPAGDGIDISNSNANLSFPATTVNKGGTSNIGVDLTNNATRNISFTSLAVTTTNNFALNANNSGAVSALGGSLTQNGAGGGAASLTNTTLSLTFTSVSSTGGTNGLLFSGGSGTFASGTTNLQGNSGIGLLMSSSGVAANFGNTTVNSSAGDAVDITGQTGSVTFADLDLTPDANLRALDVSNTSGAISSTSGDIATTGAPAIVIAGPAGRTPLAMVLNNVDSTNSATTGVDLDLVSGNLTVNDATLATNIQNPTGNGIEVTNTASGTINFGNTTVSGSGNANGDDAGTGVVLTNNAGAVTFGALNLTPDSGERGLLATDTDAAAAGAITVGSGTITTTNDTAVEITGQATGNRTPLNIQLTAVNTTGGGVAANGIRLSNTSATGSPGGFRVLGAGGTCTNATPTCTGGRITATTGPDGPATVGGNGVRLDNADNVRLTRMRIDGHPNNGIRGTNVNTFVLDASLVQTNGSQVDLVNREGGVTFDGGGAGNGLVGPSSITNSDIRGGFNNNLLIDNNSGTLNLTMSGNTIRDTNPAVLSNDNVIIDLDGTAQAFVSVTGSTFANAGGSHLQMSMANTVVGHLTFTGNTLTGTEDDTPNYLGMNVFLIGASWDGTARYNISNNNITGTNSGGAIHTNKGSGTGDMQGTISGNTIGSAVDAESGASDSSGITVASRGVGGQHRAVVSNNTINQTNEFGINLEAGEDGNASVTSTAATLDVTVTGNTVGAQGANALHGIHLNSGVVPGDNNNVCADIGGAGALANNAAAGANEANGGSDIRPRQRFATQVRLPGYGGTAFDNAAVNAYMTGRNVLTTVSTTNNNDATRADDGYVGGGACAQPSAPTLPTSPAMNAVLDEAAEKLVARQSQSLVIPGLMITQPPRPQTAGRAGTLAAEPQPAVAPVAQAAAQQPKARSEKSAGAQTSKGGEEKSKKREGGKIDVTRPSAGQFEVNIGTLPANDSVTITFQVTISPTLTPAAANSVSNQGTVTADGSINKVSDDPQTTPPAAGDGSDATVTPIDKFEPEIDITTSDAETGVGESVTFTATLMRGTAPADPLPTGTINFVDTQGDMNPANDEVLCANVALSAGASSSTAQCQTTAVDAGTRTIAAIYSGDGRYDPAADTVQQTVAVVLDITVSDARAAEASQLATFTVHLSGPSAGVVTVDFTTADEPAGAGKAVAGQDYTATSGTVTFQPGQTLRTISVPVTDDGRTGEPDETFLVQLSNPAGGQIADGQAVGTITEQNPAGAILISELRTSGPGGAGDEFVELYNNSDAPVTVQASDAAAGWALAASNQGCAGDPQIVGVIPNGTVIPARGHYLLVGSAYSLAAVAAGDLTLAADLAADANVALFNTSSLLSFSAQTRLDAVGFFDGVAGLGGNCDLLREGTPLNAAQGSTSQYSFFRRLSSGRPADTGRSVDDFTLVSTTPGVAVGFNAAPGLGAPGPEGLTSPVQRNDRVKASLIDPMQPSGAEPNSVRKFCSPMTPGVEECDANRSQFGTFSIRRRFTNNTGSNVTSLRFRIVNVTAGPAPAGTADLRAISSVQVTGVPLTGGGTVTVEGTTLAGPAQPLGGGFNSALAAGTITMAQPLAPGASVAVQFLLGVQQPGAYSFFVNVEAGPPPAGPLSPIKGETQPAKEGLNKTESPARQ